MGEQGKAEAHCVHFIFPSDVRAGHVLSELGLAVRAPSKDCLIAGSQFLSKRQKRSLSFTKLCHGKAGVVQMAPPFAIVPFSLTFSRTTELWDCSPQ